MALFHKKSTKSVYEVSIATDFSKITQTETQKEQLRPKHPFVPAPLSYEPGTHEREEFNPFSFLKKRKQ